MRKHLDLLVKTVMALLIGASTLTLLGLLGWGLWMWRYEGLKILVAIAALALMFAIGRTIIGDKRWYRRG